MILNINNFDILFFGKVSHFGSSILCQNVTMFYLLLTFPLNCETVPILESNLFVIDLSRVTAAILSGGAKMHFLKWPFVHFWLEIHEGLKQSWCNLVVMSTMDYRCRFFNFIVNMMSTSLIIHAWWHNFRKWQIRYKSTKTCQ